MKAATGRTEAQWLLDAADFLYWLLANNQPFKGPLYWTQDQWDECNDVRSALASLAARKTQRERSR